MSSLKIEESFTVNAPVARVWKYLLTPEEIVVCLPGAELLEVEGERIYHGQMKVKVGPVTVAYKGTMEVVEADEAARRVRMVGKGKETGGAGTAKMTMESHLSALDGGGTEVRVNADVDLAGRIVRFGRGMIQGVSEQLFKQFVGNIQELLENAPDDGAAAGQAAEAAAAAEAEAAAATEAEAAAPAAAEAAAPAVAEAAAPAVESKASEEAAGEGSKQAEATASEPAAEASAGHAGKEDKASDSEASAEKARVEEGEKQPAPGEAAAKQAEVEASASAGETAAEPEAKASGAAEAKASQAAPTAVRKVAAREAEPVKALPLILRALWSSIRGFFRRLFGGSA